MSLSASFSSPAQRVAQHLYTRRSGAGGDPVVLVHGWSCQSADWEELQAALDDRHLLALDLPGHGNSVGVDWQDWTISGLAAVVAAFAASQGIQTLTLVGHSMGGVVSLEAARLWAEAGGQVEKVILVDTFGLPYGDMDAATIAAIETPFRENFVSAMNDLVDNTTVKELPRARRDVIKARMASANPQKMLPLWADLLSWSPDAVFAQRPCPIYALNGEHISEAAQNRCAPHVQTRVITGSHHFPQFEQPEAFATALRALL